MALTDPAGQVLMTGNEAAVEGAIAGGCRCFSGYPITPATEIAELMSVRMPQVDGTYIFAESELAVINILTGAASVGVLGMTATSGLGFSLMAEGMSNLAAMEFPAVIINVCRGGPGAGNLGPSQSDYFQATKGHGHGDYRVPVLAPWSPQETADDTAMAFALADRYRTPIVILSDSVVAHAMEPVVVPEPVDPSAAPPREWAITPGGPVQHHGGDDMPDVSGSGQGTTFEALQQRLGAKYREIQRQEMRVESEGLDDDPQLVFVAFGSAARVVVEAKRALARHGIRTALIRPRTLWPFPRAVIREALAKGGVPALVVELSMGQFVEDVAAAAGLGANLHLLGTPEARLLPPERIVDEAEKILAGGDRLVYER
ncbi:MAG: transketolase C-terminal domain-containing protein [Acidimicrobiia bacterium]